MSTARTKLVIELILIGALLALFCDRIWRLGIVHSDDAAWALWAYNPSWNYDVAKGDPIGLWARLHGRIWAFPIGALWLHASAWNETVYGHLLKVVSFSIFFLTFHAFVWIYCGRLLALLSATLFLALNVLRWEESILTSVPLLSWGSATLALLAILAARSYLLSSRSVLLALSAVVFFVSLFCNEGVALFFVGLFPWAVVWTAAQTAPDRPLQAKLFGPGPARRLLLSACLVPVATYVTIAVTWKLLHVSTYAGVTFAPFDPYRIARVALSFATSGSILHDLIAPYRVTYAEYFTQTGVAIDYSPFHFLAGAASSPAALLAGGVTLALMLSILSEPGVAGRPGRRFLGPDVFAVVTGVALAVAPVLPVAMTQQYQDWFFNLAVSSNSHSILSYFGVSLALAGLVSAVFRLVPAASRAALALAVLVALVVAALAVIANSMSDAIAADMRPEAARWRVLAFALDSMRAANLQARNVLAPRFRNGSWFAAASTSYWSDLAKALYGMDLTFVEPTAKLADLKGGLVYLDYLYLNEPRSVIVVLADLQTDHPGAGEVLADRILVRVEQPTQRLLDTTWLSYVDADHNVHQSRLSLLKVEHTGGLFIVPDARADPASIRIEAQAGAANLPVLCAKGLGSDQQEPAAVVCP
jgi:hypothetical protein